MSDVQLRDRFLSGVIIEQSPQLQPSTVGLQAHIGLPALLVDEELLRELAQIPDRMGFKIGEVADLLQVKQYILRYWESEFDLLKPKKAQNNQRYYTRKDVENAFLIRKLIHRDKFSIEGAKVALRGVKKVVRQEQEELLIIQRVQRLEQHYQELQTALQRLKTLFY